MNGILITHFRLYCHGCALHGKYTDYPWVRGHQTVSRAFATAPTSSTDRSIPTYQSQPTNPNLPIPTYQSQPTRFSTSPECEVFMRLVKTFGDAADATNATVANPPEGFVPSPPPAVESRASTSSGDALSTAPKSTKSFHKHVGHEFLRPRANQPQTRAYAHQQASSQSSSEPKVCINGSFLMSLTVVQGLVYKKGKIFAIEEQQLKITSNS